MAALAITGGRLRVDPEAGVVPLGFGLIACSGDDFSTGLIRRSGAFRMHQRGGFEVVDVGSRAFALWNRARLCVDIAELLAWASSVGIDAPEKEIARLLEAGVLVVWPASADPLPSLIGSLRPLGHGLAGDATRPGMVTVYAGLDRPLLYISALAFEVWSRADGRSTLAELVQAAVADGGANAPTAAELWEALYFEVPAMISAGVLTLE